MKRQHQVRYTTYATVSDNICNLKKPKPKERTEVICAREGQKMRVDTTPSSVTRSCNRCCKIFVYGGILKEKR